MRLMLAGAVRLVSSGHIGAVGVRAAPGAPGAPSSDGRQPCYGVRLTALRMSSLWSANSAQTITMIATVTMPVIADTAPCMPDVARLAMAARRLGGRDPGSSAGWPELLNAGTRPTPAVCAPGSPGMDSSRTTQWSSSVYWREAPHSALRRSADEHSASYVSVVVRTLARSSRLGLTWETRSGWCAGHRL